VRACVCDVATPIIFKLLMENLSLNK
jgi:hypothetical protein